ncbi:MAG: helix-turn-helix transcriptional regulator [Acetatifactor sp.]|nr:helix-turn-helix transcriptional regulator [Acetatifactor sp.]
MGMLILRLLEEKDMYGYEMIDTLRSRSNQVFELKAGTLYPLLHTMETRGYVSSYEEEAPSGKSRKYYRLTREGKRHVAQKKAEWQEYQSAVASVLAAERRVCYGV